MPLRITIGPTPVYDLACRQYSLSVVLPAVWIEMLWIINRNVNVFHGQVVIINSQLNRTKPYQHHTLKPKSSFSWTITCASDGAKNVTAITSLKKPGGHQILDWFKWCSTKIEYAAVDVVILHVPNKAKSYLTCKRKVRGEWERSNGVQLN